MADTRSRAMTREKLLSIIEQAAREKQTILNLSGKGISVLPDEIGELTRLQSLDLSENQLTALPESFGNLNSLQILNLRVNKLTTLHESIGNLANLQTLNLCDNQLTSLPETICQLGGLVVLDISRNHLKKLLDNLANLTHLLFLYFYSNQLTSLPDSIRSLNLQALYIGDNPLKFLPEWMGDFRNLQTIGLSGLGLYKLPEWISQLTTLKTIWLNENHLESLPESLGNTTYLQRLDLGQNQLVTLPSSLAHLEKLETLDLDDNPLDPALKSAYDQGLPALRAYLRSLEEAEPLYEAKLVLVGEGGVGKTTLLKALTGQGPREDEPTTHGVKIAVQAMRLPHPEKQGVEIQLNAWDFGGQEVYRVTHQFFFSRRSIYLLVWEPRKGAQASQVEDWLKIIRLRVGDEARVFIVSTHCKTNERMARIDKPVLERDYGSMVAGFLEVDSLVDDPITGEKTGIAELKRMIAEVATSLEQMGMPFSRHWREARDELLQLPEPRISYAQFVQVCARHGLDGISTETLAHLMHDLGYIVYYGEVERLKNDVVLQPEWLTKAIGFVLEDHKTQEMDGILPDNRLKDVWYDHPFKGEQKYGPELYPFFLRLMEKYDVSYRLEEGDASLVAQHVPQVRPSLPWLPEEECKRGSRRVGMVCAMDETPPGLVPWMIIRTHDYAYKLSGHRLHWQKGMFLRNRRHGEAMLELREREFHIYAEAAWPEFFMNVLRKTLQKLIVDNWPGMEGRYFFAVPCPERLDGKPCIGRFDINALKQFLEDGDETYRCQVCRKRHNIVDLLYGFEEIGLREQLQAIETKVEGLDSRVANVVWTILQAIAGESKEGPRLFTVTPMDADWKKRLFAERYRLHLWCEADGCQHPVIEQGLGVYEFDANQEWVKQVAPYANFIAGVLKTALPLLGPAINSFFGADTIKKLGFEDELNLTKEATSKLLPEIKPADSPVLREGGLTEVNRSGVLALHALIRELDPHQAKLGLGRIPTYTGEFRWLCQKHYDAAQSKIPDMIQFTS